MSSTAAELLCGSTGSWAFGSQVGDKCHWMFVIPGVLFPVIFHGRVSLFIWVDCCTRAKEHSCGVLEHLRAWDFFGLAVLGQFEEREDSALRAAVLIPVLAIAPSGPVALSRAPGPVHQLPRM